MNKTERLQASIDMTLTYLEKFSVEWRLIKVLANKKLLESRYGFFEDIIEDVPYSGNLKESLIAQDVKNGLFFDSISYAIQGIEDLFAFYNASLEPAFFIKNICNFKAGKISNLIKAFKATKENISKLYHIPLVEVTNDKENIYKNGLENLTSLTESLVSFYKDYHFFYSQYKHGLSVGIKPLRREYSRDQIEKDKKGKMNPYIVIYDNRNLGKVSANLTIKETGPILYPCLTPNVMKVMKELTIENNMLRLAFSPNDSNPDFDRIIDVSYNTRALTSLFITNFTLKLTSNETVKFHLLKGNKTNESYVLEFPKDLFNE